MAGDLDLPPRRGARAAESDSLLMSLNVLVRSSFETAVPAEKPFPVATRCQALSVSITSGETRVKTPGPLGLDSTMFISDHCEDRRSR
jgi:hypothetical protein